MNLVSSKNKATRRRAGQSIEQHTIAITGSRKTIPWKRLLLIIAFLAGTSPGMTFGQQQQVASGDVDAPLLTLNDAVTLALQHNRLVKNSALEAQKYDFQVRKARSRRKPQFQFSMLGGELLHSFDFTIPQGSRHVCEGTGPIPSTNAKIRTPAVFTTYVTGSIDQPLTQQYKIRSRGSRDGTGTRCRSRRCACGTPEDRCRSPRRIFQHRRDPSECGGRGERP